MLLLKMRNRPVFGGAERSLSNPPVPPPRPSLSQPLRAGSSPASNTLPLDSDRQLCEYLTLIIIMLLTKYLVNSACTIFLFSSTAYSERVVMFLRQPNIISRMSERSGASVSFELRYTIVCK